MMRVNLFIPFVLLTWVGCGGRPPATSGEQQLPGPVIDGDEPTEEIYFYLVPQLLMGESNRCMNTRSDSQRKQLQRTLLNYSKQSAWPYSLLETQSFKHRYGPTPDEKKCIKESFCSKGK